MVLSGERVGIRTGRNSEGNCNYAEIITDGICLRRCSLLVLDATAALLLWSSSAVLGDGEEQRCIACSYGYAWIHAQLLAGASES